MSRSAILVLYDDACPLCTFQMKVLTWLDWFNALCLLPISSPRAADLAPTVQREDLLEAIHCLTPRGEIHRGARCIRYLSLRLPLAIPVALVLWIPGVIWVAEKIYAWIARNRYLLSRWFRCKEACALMPTRRARTSELLHSHHQSTQRPGENQ
jgi:predicted DCC family thiol-disulfide oxidoreductase YuxK